MLPDFLTNMSQTTLIALGVALVLLVAAAGMYLWWSRAKAKVEPKLVESVHDQSEEKSAPAPLPEPSASPESEIGVVSCPDCNEPMVVASEDKSVRKCLRCNQVYEVTAE